jgi:N6-adenosine-specific RNA methylase IME4
MGKITKCISLKDKMDEIDKQIYNYAYAGLYNSKFKILIGMWEKGKIIDVVFRGVKTTPSYRELERQTGRSDDVLKKWHDLYKKYLNKEDWINEAKIKAELWVERLLNPAEIKQIETPPLPEGKFCVIYCDPPWPVGSIVMDKWESPIDDKYPIMSIEEIKKMAISKISADNCSLFLWTTHTFLPDCFEIIKEWGFKYFCSITWDKGNGWTQFGFHKKTEFLLFAYKGNINIKQEGKAIPTLIKELKTIHSKKPDEIRNTIKSKTPEGRLELFARQYEDDAENRFEGWTLWGNEIKIIENDPD